MFLHCRCDDHRCMDPALCCDPDIDANCTVVPICCLALLESNRHFYQLGMEKRNKEDMRLLHSTIFTVIGEKPNPNTLLRTEVCDLGLGPEELCKTDGSYVLLSESGMIV